jgi:hypothetical protein
MSQNPQKGFPQLRSISISRVSTGLSDWAINWQAVGVLTELDGKALEMLVEAYVEYRLTKETLEREGATKAITTTTGDVRVKPAAILESREARKGFAPCLLSLV